MIFRETQISIHIYGAAMSFLNRSKAGEDQQEYKEYLHHEI